ncbi:MAG: hypothetical protein ABJO36_13500 [Litorimonas sp.]
MRNLVYIKHVFRAGCVGLISLSFTPILAAAQTDRVFQCRMTDAQLASPKAMWDWAMSKPPGPNAPKGEGHQIIGSIWGRHGMNAIKPYIGTLEMDRYLECYEKGNDCGFSPNPKMAKSLKKGKYSSKHVKGFKRNGPLAYDERLTGHCSKKAPTVNQDIRNSGFTPGTFAPDQCEAFTKLNPDRSWSKQDQSAFLQWRADYERRGPEPDGRCIYLPTVLAKRPDVAAEATRLGKIQRAKMDAKMEENAEKFCFHGVSQSTSREKIMNSVARRTSNPLYENVTEEAVGYLDPGDGRITEASVGTAFSLYGFYRVGPDQMGTNISSSTRLSKCFRKPSTGKYDTYNVDCGLEPNSKIEDTLSSYSSDPKDERAKSAAMKEGIPEVMTPTIRDFIRHNLGNCAVKGQNTSKAEIVDRVYAPSATTKQPNSTPKEDLAAYRARCVKSVYTCRPAIGMTNYEVCEFTDQDVCEIERKKKLGR